MRRIKLHYCLPTGFFSLDGDRCRRIWDFPKVEAPPSWGMMSVLVTVPRSLNRILHNLEIFLSLATLTYGLLGLVVLFSAD